MTKYRSRPREIDAIQWTGDNLTEVQAFAGFPNFKEVQSDYSGAVLYVAANETWLPVEHGEWVIRDSKGFYPCKADVFAQNYEPVE